MNNGLYMVCRVLDTGWYYVLFLLIVDSMLRVLWWVCHGVKRRTGGCLMVRFCKFTGVWVHT